jgi:GH15 family glucan-1,4-alpha-glucosidase
MEQPSHHGFLELERHFADGSALADEPRSPTRGYQQVAFQKDCALAAGDESWFGVLSVFERFADAPSLAMDVAHAFRGKSARNCLRQELLAWEEWRTAPPSWLSTTERRIFRQSEALLRQAQVWERTDASEGQLVAALPPAAVNVCWLRHHCYAVLALSALGHTTQARAALSFVRNAEAGPFPKRLGATQSRLSPVALLRYYGRGREELVLEADNGPETHDEANHRACSETRSSERQVGLEIEGLGLTLWVFHRHVASCNDLDFLRQHWDWLDDELIESLLEQYGTDTALLGRARCYSALAAVRGLRSAADLATIMGKTRRAETLSERAAKLLEAILRCFCDASGALYGIASPSGTDLSRAANPSDSREDACPSLTFDGIFQGEEPKRVLDDWAPGLFPQVLDASVIEAINWGVLDAQPEVARATLARIREELSLHSGEYCSEHLFLDLAMLSAAQRLGEDKDEALWARILDRAAACHDTFPELWPQAQNEAAGDELLDARYGAFPMVGCGAAAYLLCLLSRRPR